MSKKNDPAFPVDIPDRVSEYSDIEFAMQGGLTKREYFAVRALQGLLSTGQNKMYISRMAVAYADDLIKALEEVNE